MADPFTFTVLVTGLTSLGTQLAQSLKRYADSAIDSKGRILAISLDVELAVQVVRTFDAMLQKASSRASLTEDAEKLAKDVVTQCQNVFDGISKMLPDIDLIGLKKMDAIKWAIIEAKVELFRGDLERIKLTLQVLMSVMIYAAMLPSTTDLEHIFQQRLEIRRLQEEEANVTARLATSRSKDRGVSVIHKPMQPLRSRPQTSSSVESPDGSSSVSSLDSIDRRLNGVSTAPGTHHRVPNVAAGIREGTENLYLTPRPKRTSRYATKLLTLMNRGAALLASPKVPELFQSPMQMLKTDYERCLEQLSTLQAAIEVTTQITFDPNTGLAYENRDEAITLALVDMLKWHGQNTIDCLYTHLMDSAALRKIRKRAKACPRMDVTSHDIQPRSYVEYLSCYDPRAVQVRDGVPEIKTSSSPSLGLGLIPTDIDLEDPAHGDGADMSETRSIGSIYEELPSVDDLVRRWIVIHSDDTTAEPRVNSSSGLQAAIG